MANSRREILQFLLFDWPVENVVLVNPFPPKLWLRVELQFWSTFESLVYAFLDKKFCYSDRNPALLRIFIAQKVKFEQFEIESKLKFVTWS